MDYFFSLLSALSLGLLIAGLTKPDRFKDLFRRPSVDKSFIWKVFGTSTVAFFLLNGIFSQPAPAPYFNNPSAVKTSVVKVDEKTTSTPVETPSIVKPGVKAVVQSVPAEPKKENVTTPAVEPTQLPVFYSVTKVTDGDTIKVSINGIVETIRLIGMNTPETVDPRKSVECFGVEASNRAKQLLSGKKVRLEADPTQGERDKYNRLLRYVWTEEGTFYNKKMLLDGYASEYTYKVPYKYQSEFKLAVNEAREAKRGLWADNACISKETTVPTANQPATSTSGHTFYTSSHYSAKYYYCDTDEGYSGLSPSYLKSFSSEAELLSKYKRTLHEPCK